MGTPNSEYTTEQIQLVKDIFFDGKKFDEWDFHRMGLDVEFLERAVARVKPQLPYIPGYRSLIDTFNGHHDSQYWRRVVCSSEFKDVLCLRLTQPSWSGKGIGAGPLVRLKPTAFAGTAELELFVTRSGQWIVVKIYEPTQDYAITTHATTDEFRARLEELNAPGGEHTIDQELYLFEIAYALIRLFESSIEQRQSRLDLQERSMKEWEQFRSSVFRQ